ncbi:MAG: DUF3999 family protein, partial [Mucilaginibacter sp.]
GQKVNFGCLMLFAFSLLALPVWAQRAYKYKADIKNVDSSGVYKIKLQPGFVAKSTSRGLYDTRVVDETGKFIAYAIVTNPLDKVQPVFIIFPEVKQGAHSDTATIYIAENKNKDNVNELWLKLKNTAVSRLTNLSGSDDLQHWFAIKEDIRLQDADSGNDTEYEQMLSFPASNYRYFRIQISNKNKDLIKITRCGIYVSDDRTQALFTTLPAVTLSTKNGNKQTSYFVDLDDNYVVDGLKLNISSPKYYDRQISVYNIGNKTEVRLCDTSITSSAQGYISISAKTNKLRIDITNGDDNPLVVKDIEAIALQQYAVSYLEKEHRYYLLTGDTSMNEVSYDLSFLHSKPLLQFPVISHSAVYKNPAYLISKPGARHDFTLLIWIAIVSVLILLSLLTWRMVKEINSGPKA